MTFDALECFVKGFVSTSDNYTAKILLTFEMKTNNVSQNVPRKIPQLTDSFFFKWLRRFLLY